MSYNSVTDFIGLLRNGGGGVQPAEMPGLDFTVAALARAGLINLYVGQTAPVVNQLTTAWFQPALPTYAAEGVLFLWDDISNSYKQATPGLWNSFIGQIGNGISAAMQPVCDAATLPAAIGLMGATPQFDTKTEAAAATIAASIDTIRTGGDATAGDGGYALYYRVGGPTGGGFQSADGAWWALSSMGTAPQFDSRAVAAAASIAASINVIRTGGYAAAGDGGDALYYRVGGSTAGGFQSADGAWWRLVSQPSIGSPAQFDTRTDAAAALIPSLVTFLRTAGYAATGDGGAALYEHASGSTAGGFQSAEGQWWQLATQTLYAEMFGIKGDGLTNNAAAMASAHSTGLLIHYRDAQYNFTNFSFSEGGGIAGDGIGRTRLLSTDTTAADLITFTGTGSSVQIPLFRDFLLQGGGKSAGAGLRFLPSSGEIQYINIDNVLVFGTPISVQFSAASLWSIENSKFLNYTIAGVWVENTNNADSGDSGISNCLFNTGTGAGAGVEYRSSGGLKISNCKFNGGNYAIQLAYTGTVNSGDLLVSNCSVENMTNQGIVLGRLSGTHTFGAIVITGTEFSIVPTCIQTDASGAINNVVVTGCQLNFNGAAGAGVSLNSVNNFVVSGNNISGPGGGTSFGVFFSGCNEGLVASNAIFNVNTKTSVAAGSVYTANNPT